MGLFNKKELSKIAELESKLTKIMDENKIQSEILDKVKGKELYEIEEMILEGTKKEQELKNEIDNLQNEILEKTKKLDESIAEKRKLLSEIEIDIEMSEFGLYKPKYQCMNSEEYAKKIKDNRDIQKKMIKDKMALFFYDNWTLDGNKAKGKAMNNDNMKMYLRAYNNECEVLINKVKYNNFDTVEKQIKKCGESLDKLNVRNKISLKQGYINLKIEELRLVHEYNVVKQEEKEKMREARAEEKEIQRIQKEIEESRKKINKEKMHYENIIGDLIIQLETASDEKKNDIQMKLNEMNNELIQINKSIEEIDYREANQRAGYVYVISNIGSFGEDVYKIGMTRRLEPMDRVDELGDASVPFKFDVHAMIFSDDAPKLENALHIAFEKNKVNAINGRKEFFNVKLEEIEKVVKANHDKLIEFIKQPEAEQYRESLVVKNNIR